KKEVKEKKTIRSSSERRRKEAKNARLDKFESALEKWAESVSARTEVSKAKAEKYKSLASQATSSCTDPYSIEACMGLLNSLDNVSKTMYNKAVAKFVQAEWRCIFMTMPTERRMDWLLDLD
ncbi:hypothetical protein PIB30_115117, partial [Stylosanthes scabra]|nr:hypothetical protein [Stylosanthes scabra]